MKKNDIVRLEIEDLNNLGFGVARIDGKAVFVSGAVTGDTVEAQLIKVNASYAVAIVKKYGFAVNDLYAVSAALPEEAHSDATHYNTSLGTEAFTKQVLSYVVPALGITEEVHYQEVLRSDAPIGV